MIIAIVFGLALAKSSARNITIHTDVPRSGFIDMQFDHSFSCEVASVDASITVDFVRTNDDLRPKNITKLANALKVDKSFWTYDVQYKFTCKAKYANGYEESASKFFSSETFSSELNFSVSPKVGIPL